MRSLLGGFGGKESTCQRRRCGFYPWVGTIPWRRKWQPTPVLLSGESPGQRSLVGYSPWGHRVRHGLVTEYACNHVQGFHFLHLLASICYLWYFWWWPFWPEWGDISLWFLISISKIGDHQRSVKLWRDIVRAPTAEYSGFFIAGQTET